MIAILVPVLGRPANAAPLAENVRAATTVEHHLVFFWSAGDGAQFEACHAIRPKVDVRRMSEPAGPGDYARKINYGYELAGYLGCDWVFTGADDLDFQPGWAEAALDEAEETGADVIGTNDLANPLVKAGRHATHSLVRRSYVEERGATFDETPGVLYSEAYDHQCVDNELREVAVARGVWAFAADSHVRHRHPFYDRSVRKDATYEKGLRYGRDDLRIFQARRREWARKVAR